MRGSKPETRRSKPARLRAWTGGVCSADFQVYGFSSHRTADLKDPRYKGASASSSLSLGEGQRV